MSVGADVGCIKAGVNVIRHTCVEHIYSELIEDMAGRFGFVVFEGVPDEVLQEAYEEVRAIAQRTGYGRQVRVHGQAVTVDDDSSSSPSVVEISSDDESGDE